KKGFTLIELVVVIAVIAILTAIAIPAFSNVMSQANASVDAANVRMLKQAGAMYITDPTIADPAAGTTLTSTMLKPYLGDAGVIPNKAGTSTPWTVTIDETNTKLVLVS
ncbi:MAG: prepilin-type N-terminal cleavage/methylation domain-containing protein, partial [Bacillota bacterium]